MRSKIGAFVLTFFFCGTFHPGKAGEQPPAKKFETKSPSLIRKDLLQSKGGDVGFPKRNIFAAYASFSQRTEPVSLEGQQPVAVSGTEAGGVAAVMPSFPGSINLRYIGYINSSRKIIAMVMFNDQAMAVGEGEVLGEGIRVVKVTSREIEIIGPDSEKRKFSLEGEDR